MKSKFIVAAFVCLALVLVFTIPAFAANAVLTFEKLGNTVSLDGLSSLSISKSDTITVAASDLSGSKSVQVLLVPANGKTHYISKERITAAGTYVIPKKIGSDQIKKAYLYNFVEERYFRVDFIGFDGNTVLTTQQIADGGYIDLASAPVIPETETRKVLGWFLADSGNPFSLSTPIHENIRLMPWVTNIYKVEFIGFDGSTVLATQHIVDGGYIDASAAPVIENTDTRRVLGWFLADSGNPFSLSAPIHGDIRLMPWVTNVHKVEFIGTDGNTILKTIFVDEGAAITDAPEMHDSDTQIFMGWYLADSGNPFSLATPIYKPYRLMPWFMAK